MEHNLLTAFCRVCGATAPYLFTGELIGQSVCYFDCSTCGYVQTESPSWLESAYSKVIADSDTGIMSRNQVNAKLTLAALIALRNPAGIVVDCAGGYGILVRLLRDFGVNAFWSDPYCNNLLAQGFEYDSSTPPQQPVALVTAFEAFEHFVNPAEEIAKMFDMAPNVLLSTTLVPEPAPPHENWWYYGKEHGQHVGFFRKRTLKYLAEKHGKYLITDGRSRHLFTSRQISRAYWAVLKKGRDTLPLVFARINESKTWSDHELLARKSKANAPEGY